MQASQDILYAFRMVILNEGDVLPHGLIEELLIEAFEEETTVVTEDLGSMSRTSGIRVGVTFIRTPFPSED